MKIIRSSILFASVALAASLGVAQAEGLSGNVSVYSLYKSRGIDQSTKGTDAYPALQAGLSYGFKSGVYVGVWGSTGKFENARAEIDLNAGYRHAVTDNLTFDYGLYRYIYPNQLSWSSDEAYVGVTYKQFSLYAYQGLTRGVNNKANYFQATFRQPLTQSLTAVVSAGYNTAGVDRVDGSVGVEYAFSPALVGSFQVQSASRQAHAYNESANTRAVVGLTYNY